MGKHRDDREKHAKREAFYTGMLTEAGLAVARAAIDAGLEQDAVKRRWIRPPARLGWFLLTNVTATPLPDLWIGGSMYDYAAWGQYLAHDGKVHEVERGGIDIDLHGPEPNGVEVAWSLGYAGRRQQVKVDNEEAFVTEKDRLAFFAITHQLNVNLGG